MTRQEFPFFLYGKETSDNVIEFNEFMTSSNNRQGMAAIFNQEMINDLSNRINDNVNNGLVDKLCFL